MLLCVAPRLNIKSRDSVLRWIPDGVWGRLLIAHVLAHWLSERRFPDRFTDRFSHQLSYRLSQRLPDSIALGVTV